VKGEFVLFPVANSRGEVDLLMMTVTSGVGLTVEIDQGFGVTEISGETEREVQCRRLPLLRNLKAATHEEVLVRRPPEPVGFQDVPVFGGLI